MLPGPSASDVPATTWATCVYAWGASEQWRSQGQQHLQGKFRDMGKPLSSCAPRLNPTMTKRRGLSNTGWVILVSLPCSSVAPSLPALSGAGSSGVVYFAVSDYKITWSSTYINFCVPKASVKHKCAGVWSCFDVCRNCGLQILCQLEHCICSQVLAENNFC